MNADNFGALTERVLGAVFEVSNTLGAGFLERVYQRGLIAELRLRGINAAAEVPFKVSYKGCRLINFQKPKAEWKRIACGLRDSVRAADEAL